MSFDVHEQHMKHVTNMEKLRILKVILITFIHISLEYDRAIYNRKMESTIINYKHKIVQNEKLNF